jgi:hypothetical protein
MWAHYLCTMFSVQFKCKSKIIWTPWTNVSHPPYVMCMLKKLLGMKFFNITVSHFICFFKGALPSLNGSTCCPYLFGMLNFDHSCTYHSFPTRWSPHSSQCGDTCRNQKISLTTSAMGYPSFINLGCLFSSPPLWESCDIIVFTRMGCFDELFTCNFFATLSIDVPFNVTWTCFGFYRSNRECY